MSNIDNTPQAITAHFKSLRIRSGLTLSELAERLGYRGASSIQRYEDASSYKGGYLRFHLVRKLEAALIGEGEPAITVGDVRKLAGPYMNPFESETRPQREPAAATPEIVIGNGVLSIEQIDEWGMPKWFTAHLSEEGDAPIIVAIKTSSKGETVFVDRTKNSLNRPGQYAILDQTAPSGFRVESYDDARLLKDGPTTFLRMDVIGRVIAKFTLQ